MSIERRPLRTSEPAIASNGSGVTIDSPLPERLCELEKRISLALTEQRTPSALADLLEQVDLAVIAAHEFAQSEHEAALDPTICPEPRAARERAEDAAFRSNRLKTLRPRLLHRYQQVCAQAEVDAYEAKRAELKPHRDALEAELRETYQEATAKLTDLFARVRSFHERMQQQLGDPPAGCNVLAPIDGMRVLDALLPDIDQPDRNVWPPPSAFAAEFAQSIAVPHPGRAWCDPAVQGRRRAELVREQEHSAAYHEQAAREEEERKNRELKEQFAASQRH